MKRLPNVTILYLTLVCFAFTLGFYKNFWGVVEQPKFKKSDIYCQSQVIGRVIKANKDGILSEGGFTGWIRNDSIVLKTFQDWIQMANYQFEIYTKELDIDPTKFIIYDSQMGGQGMTFALLDKISPFSNSQNLKLFWLLTSLSLAIVLSVFIFWVYRNYGLIASLITLLFLIVSPWLTCFGRNIYWILSSFFFPFIIMLLLLFKESEHKSTISLGILFMISMGLVFAKLFFSGFELITAALVMLTIPLFYYWFLGRWKLIIFIKRFITVVLGAITGILLHTIAYTYQFSTLNRSFLSGIQDMVYNFLKRTSGNSSDFPEVFKASLESKVIDVLRIYLKSPAIDMSTIKVTFEAMFISFFIFSVLIFIPRRISQSIYQIKRKTIALMLTTLISVIAPLSWFIIFKAHSYIHTDYDVLVWYMPFCLFGFALIGSITSSLGKDIVAFFKKWIHTSSDTI